MKRTEEKRRDAEAETPEGRAATLCAVARSLGFGREALAGISACAAMDGLVPLPDAARMLHLDRRTLHKWCAAGEVEKRPGVGRTGSLVRLAAVLEAARRRGMGA